MPAYNEAASIEAAIADVAEHVLSAVEESELIVIDDGSTDATRDILEPLREKHPRLRVVTQANAGHGPALLRGFAEAKGATLLLLDSDRQILLDGFGDHWRRMSEDGLVALLGVRRPRRDALHRLVISALMRCLILICFGRAPRDAGAPYKIVRRSEVEEARRLIADKSWIPSVLLAIYLLERRRDGIAEIEITHLARETGASSLNLRRLVLFCRNATVEIFRFRSKLRDARRE